MVLIKENKKMKNIILSLIAVVIFGFANAQDEYVQAYRSFESFQENYEPITNGDTVWPSLTFTGEIPIGFELESQFGVFDSLSIWPGGMSMKNNAKQGFNINVAFQEGVRFEENANTVVLSSLVEKPEGLVLILEFKNLFVSDNVETEQCSYQIWLYENSNVIEYRYGGNSFSETHSFIQDSLIVYYSAYEPKEQGGSYVAGQLLSGDYNSPDVFKFDVTEPRYINKYPSEGTVYRFGEVHTAIQEINENVEVKLLKENTVFIINVEADNNLQAAEVYSITGKLLKEKQLNGRNSEIDFSGLSNGVYLLKVKTQRGTVVKKVTR
jgi:hypothetical protein